MKERLYFLSSWCFLLSALVAMDTSNSNGTQLVQVHAATPAGKSAAGTRTNPSLGLKRRHNPNDQSFDFGQERERWVWLPQVVLAEKEMPSPTKVDPHF